MGHDDHEHGHDHGHEHDHDHHDHEHGHAGHAHAHDHAHHGHGHDHAHAHHAHGPEVVRSDLARGAGKGKVLYLDAPSGLAGDMIIAALVDLGVPEIVVANAIAALPLTGFHVHFGTRVRSGIVATSFDVHEDTKQPQRTYASVRALLDESKLSSEVRAIAQRTFLKLAQAEAKVHRMPLDGVHFHEVGAVDSIVDVVGSSAAIEHLGAEIVVSPLPMGKGFTRAAHGVLPLPAPATVECLAGLATYDAGMDFEFVTPTGAAIVGAHARASSRWPSMSPERVGWGAGTKDLKDRPNVLRAVLGVASPSESANAHGDASTSAATLTHSVLEANVDDATGEIVAAAIESLFAEGALDAWATPITMKKGRPALTLSALCPIERAGAVSAAILRETSSLGVRRHDVSRVERPRRMISVETPYGPIPVKIAEGPYGPAQKKPEFDACAAAARAHGVPVREVIRAALAAAG